MSLPNPFNSAGQLSSEDAAMACMGEVEIKGVNWKIRWKDHLGLGDVVRAVDFSFHGLAVDKDLFHSVPYFVTSDGFINYVVIATDDDHDHVVPGYISTLLNEAQMADVPETVKIDTTLESMTALSRDDMESYEQTIGRQQVEILKQFIHRV
jgi:hypothetical protein